MGWRSAPPPRSLYLGSVCRGGGEPEPAMTMRLFELDHEATSDDWYTPGWIFDGLGITFDIDVASPPFATNVPARDRFTESDDGLGQQWAGTVWCNPPYSRPARWARRWADHGDGCLLVRADLSTAAIHYAFAAASGVYVPAKRLQFEHADGRPTGAVTFSTVLLTVGTVSTVAIGRLADRYGGTARRLGSVSS